MIRKIRNSFITGLVIFLPLGVTIFVVDFLLGMFKEPAIKAVESLGWQRTEFFIGFETFFDLETNEILVENQWSGLVFRLDSRPYRSAISRILDRF